MNLARVESSSNHRTKNEYPMLTISNILLSRIVSNIISFDMESSSKVCLFKSAVYQSIRQIEFSIFRTVMSIL